MKLIPRKRIDIRVADLLAGVALCVRARDGRAAGAAVEARFGGAARDACVACFSVRTGFALALEAMNLEPGDEVLMSAFNIPHMAELVRLHGAVPVPIDLDPRTMSPDWEQMKAAITPRTRAVVVAHLFGGHFDVSPGVELAKEAGLLFVEDAAQAFDYGGWRGHPQADVGLFSFGAIKTGTALGGAVALVRNAPLLARMRELNAALPERSNLSFARKLAKYLVLRALTVPLLYGLAARLSTVLSIDFDRAINSVTRSFRGDDLLAALRFRPSSAQLSLLRRRLERPRSSRVELRAAAGAQVAAALPDSLRLLGGGAARHAHWLFPVLCAQPDRLIAHLRRAGYDATRGGTTLSPVRRAGTGAPRVERFFDHIVYLPVDGHLRAREVRQLTRQLSAFALCDSEGDAGTPVTLEVEEMSPSL